MTENERTRVMWGIVGQINTCPTTTNSAMRKYLMGEYGISYTEADDIVMEARIKARGGALAGYESDSELHECVELIRKGQRRQARMYFDNPTYKAAVSYLRDHPEMQHDWKVYMQGGSLESKHGYTVYKCASCGEERIEEVCL